MSNRKFAALALVALAVAIATPRVAAHGASTGHAGVPSPYCEGKYIAEGWTEVSSGYHSGGGWRMAIDGFDPNRLLLGTGTHLALSNDGGCSWQEPELTAGWVVGLSVPQSRRQDDPGYALGLCDQPGVCQSESLDRPFILSIAPLPLGYGYNVQPVGELPEPGRSPSLTVASSNPRILFVAQADMSGTYAVFKSSDGGSSWKVVHRDSSAAATGGVLRAVLPRDIGVAVDPVDEKRVWTWNEKGLMSSRNGGRSWQTVPLKAVGCSPPACVPPTGLADLEVSHRSGGPIHLVGLRSGCTWASRPCLFASKNGGKTWTVLPDPPGGVPGGTLVTDYGLHPHDPRVIFVVRGDQLFEFDPGSQGWTDLGAPDPPDDQSYSAIAFDQARYARVYLLRGDGVVLRSEQRLAR